jgi:hypothetical protein
LTRKIISSLSPRIVPSRRNNDRCLYAASYTFNVASPDQSSPSRENAISKQSQTTKLWSRFPSYHHLSVLIPLSRSSAQRQPHPLHHMLLLSTDCPSQSISGSSSSYDFAVISWNRSAVSRRESNMTNRNSLSMFAAPRFVRTRNSPGADPPTPSDPRRHSFIH